MISIWQDRILFLSKQKQTNIILQPRWVLQKYVHKICKIVSIVYISFSGVIITHGSTINKKIWLMKQKVKQTGLF